MNHYNVLATIEDSYGLDHIGGSLNRPPVSDIFVTATSRKVHSDAGAPVRGIAGHNGKRVRIQDDAAQHIIEAVGIDGLTTDECQSRCRWIIDSDEEPAEGHTGYLECSIVLSLHRDGATGVQLNHYVCADRWYDSIWAQHQT